MKDRQRANGSFVGVGGLTSAIKAEESFREISRSPDRSHENERERKLAYLRGKLIGRFMRDSIKSVLGLINDIGNYAQKFHVALFSEFLRRKEASLFDLSFSTLLLRVCTSAFESLYRFPPSSLWFPLEWEKNSSRKIFLLKINEQKNEL